VLARLLPWTDWLSVVVAVYCHSFVSVSRGCFASLVLALFAPIAVVVVVVVVPRDAAARPVGPGAHSPRPKTTRVLLETDGPDVVLEGQAPAATGEGADHSAGPAGASAQPSVAENASENSSAAGDGEGETSAAEAPLPLDEGKWDAICSPPCQRRLPRSALFRITGAGITTSATFTLPPGRPAVTLDVKTGTARWYWTGVIVTALGGSFLVGGVAPPLLLGGSLSTAGKVLGGTGAVMLGVGLPLWILNRTVVAIF
jgi:hypothetical protein